MNLIKKIMRFLVKSSIIKCKKKINLLQNIVSRKNVHINMNDIVRLNLQVSTSKEIHLGRGYVIWARRKIKEYL